MKMLQALEQQVNRDKLLLKTNYGLLKRAAHKRLTSPTALLGAFGGGIFMGWTTSCTRPSRPREDMAEHEALRAAGTKTKWKVASNVVWLLKFLVPLAYTYYARSASAADAKPPPD
jgi:hypothetical protein